MAAQQATLTLIGRSGRTYSVDVHAPDAANTQLCFNPSGAAASTSPATMRVPEDCVIYDISIAASPTATGVVLYNNSGAIQGGSLRWANQLDSLVNRQKLRIPLKQGDIISGLQFT
jgi:hypothetical protein